MRAQPLVYLVVAVLAARVVHAERAIPDDNLAYPVLITLDTGKAASGFFVNTDHTVYFVTARHVLAGGKPLSLLAKSATLLSYPRVPTEEGTNLFHLDLDLLRSQGRLRWHDDKDVVVIHLADVVLGSDPRKVSVVPGVTLRRSTPSGILGVAKGNLKKLSDVLVANEVFVFGYPRSLGLKALPQMDLDRPLLRRGIVAGVNPSLRSIILDGPVYPGNSGGPVLEVETLALERKFRVIGLVSEFVPFVETWVSQAHGWQNSTVSNSGYSVLTPCDFILALIESERGP